MRFAGWVLLAGLLVLTGCGKFFPPLSQSGGGSGGGSTTGNYLYVANSNPNLNTLAGFSLASGALTNTSGSPYASPLTPTCLAMTPSDRFLYVGSTAGAIYVYSIGSDGSLALGNGKSPVLTGNSPITMEIDPTGQWMIWISAFSGEAYAMGINATTGALSNVNNAGVGLASTSASGLAITPNDQYVYVALGTGGVETLGFNASTGALAAVNTVLAPVQNLDADRAVAVSPNGQYLFVTETGINAVRVFSIRANGTLSEVTGSPFKTGLGPAAVLVDSTGSYVYVANRTDNTISAFTVGTTGGLTAITGSPFSTGTTPVALAEDRTKGYVAVANQGGNPDLQVFQISTTTPGALVSTATSSTGTAPTQAIAIAATQ
ncbi:MAG: lactonase family protein [Acidobacteriaceae bacterium]